MLQITEVQSKVNVLSAKVNETVNDVLRFRSEHFDELDKAEEEADGDDDDNDDDGEEYSAEE